MDIQSSHGTWKWQVVYTLYLCSWGCVSGQLRYSVVEESEPGTVVGDLAQDLVIAVSDIAKRRLHLRPGSRSNYFSVHQEHGSLSVKERIDRESLCGFSTNCLLQIEIVTENPVELFNVEIDILDINDNSPIFANPERILRITELVISPGTRFLLESAQDADVGSNAVTGYRLSASPYFSLSTKTRKDGTLIPELILEKNLDREQRREHKLILTAFDGSDHPRTGTCQINVIVVDINDNSPIFDQHIYKTSLLENTPLKTVVLKLNAIDNDEGINAKIEYFFDDHISDSARTLFGINKHTGEIYTKGVVDFEDCHYWELPIRAVDKGIPELEGQCMVQVEIEDSNDNSPEIIFTSVTHEIPENAALGSAVGFLIVNDRDSGKNGEIVLNISPNLPFILKPVSNRYSLITDGFLDREKVSQYTVTITAVDLGSPSLQTQIVVTLNISDINDNPPVFDQHIYNAFVRENNEPGSLLCTVSATDLDEGINSQIVYYVAEHQIDGFSASSFLYINQETGNIYAQRSFDYEQIQVLEITIKAEDLGFPKLNSNVSIFIFVLDTNDNYPTVLYPDNARDLYVQENVPKTATVGYLVTKISAVDLDSGHNAWLVFKLVEATSPGLFEVTVYNGEVRTLQDLQEVDNSEQKLVISISDHGDPSLSTTISILVNIVDNGAYESPKSHELFTSSKPPPDITFYLIISLVAICLVSLVTFIILLVKCLKKEDGEYSCGLCFINKSEPKYYSDQYKPTLYLNTDGTLKYMEVRMVPSENQGKSFQPCFSQATDIRDLAFVEPPNLTHNLHDMANETEASSDATWLNETKQAQPNTEWRFSQAQRPGPSGAQPTEEAGVWPNNQFETERLQAMILASANEAAEGTSGLGGGTGTMGLSARYGPQFTLQHVPDYRQNVYIPGSTLTPTNGAGKREGKASGNKKKSGKKEKK
ncbi:protocadherin gamma-C5-like isoform X8 [Pelobates fuscus]|uniref:protocadherin gamma-C5-like isoform X8 n=1 Tax=Pelobates fuscus TaxID=191477 RepID=UPI002FE4D4A7